MQQALTFIKQNSEIVVTVNGSTTDADAAKVRHFYTAGFYPSGAVVVFNLRTVTGRHEAYLNPADPDQAAILERLARQRILKVVFKSEDGDPVTVELGQSPVTREELRRTLQRAVVHGNRMRIVDRSWSKTVETYQGEGVVPWQTAPA